LGKKANVLVGHDQERLAAELGVSQAAVSRWESGLREPMRDIYLELWMLAFNTQWAPVFYKKAGLTENKLRRYLGVLRQALEQHNGSPRS
jgi:transcriptional regulator with XRE-family HTH domain